MTGDGIEFDNVAGRSWRSALATANRRIRYVRGPETGYRAPVTNDEDVPPPSEVRRLVAYLGDPGSDPLLGLLLTREERAALEAELAEVERQNARATA